MPTHFLCIPLPVSQLANSLASFRADVTSPLSFAIPDDAVRPLKTLHLTLGVMTLKEEGIAKAAELLQRLKLAEILSKARAARTEITSRGVNELQTSSRGQATGANQEIGLRITLRGLRTMQAPSKATVLYAPPDDPDGVIHSFCMQVKAAFEKGGIMEKESRPLLLHATIVNTIYVKGRAGDGRASTGPRKERLTIDARSMLERYNDIVWMDEGPVRGLAICKMGAKRIEGTDDTAYEVVASVNF